MKESKLQHHCLDTLLPLLVKDHYHLSNMYHRPEPYAASSETTEKFNNILDNYPLALRIHDDRGDLRWDVQLHKGSFKGIFNH